MGSVILSDPINGTLTDATLIAANNAALKGVINGGLDNNNVASAAAISPSKLAGYPSDYSKVLRGNGEWATLGFPPPTLPVVIGSATYVANTLTPIVNLAIPAGSLGTTRSILTRITGTIFNSTTVNKPYRLFVSLGGTTIYDSNMVGGIPSSGNRRAFWLDVEIYNQNATNKQHMSGVINISGVGTQPAVGIGNLTDASFLTAPFVSPLAGTAVDTTLSQTLLIQWAWNTQHASLVLTANQVRSLLLG